LHARVKVVAFPSAIDSVLRDFPYNLRHITGELVLAQGEFENYASLVVVPEAQSCVVTRYHSADDTTASWQAKMFSSDDFDEANRKYQQLYRQLKTCYVKLVDGSIFYLEGQWEPAKDGASFTTSTLRLMTGDWRYKEVKVELELVYLLADWAVNINIVSKRRDDEVGEAVRTRGETIVREWLWSGSGISIGSLDSAAVHLDGSAGDIAGQGGSQEGHECGQFFRPADPA
jgi:hypothetical protein